MAKRSTKNCGKKCQALQGENLMLNDLDMSNPLKTSLELLEELEKFLDAALMPGESKAQIMDDLFRLQDTIHRYDEEV